VRRQKSGGAAKLRALEARTESLGSRGDRRNKKIAGSLPTVFKGAERFWTEGMSEADDGRRSKGKEARGACPWSMLAKWRSCSVATERTRGGCARAGRKKAEN
jgi:hypothetical protein